MRGRSGSSSKSRRREEYNINPVRYKVTYMMRRVCHLLRVFYNWKVAKVETPELVSCDCDRVIDVAFKLHMGRPCHQLDPPRLEALMSQGGEDFERSLLVNPVHHNRASSTPTRTLLR